VDRIAPLRLVQKIDHVGTDRDPGSLRDRKDFAAAPLKLSWPGPRSSGVSAARFPVVPACELARTTLAILIYHHLVSEAAGQRSSVRPVPKFSVAALVVNSGEVVHHICPFSHLLICSRSVPTRSAVAVPN